MVDTSELDRLSAATEQYNALMEFLEEFMPAERLSLYQHRTGLTDQRVCKGPRGHLLDYCPWTEKGIDCSKCHNTGFYEITVDDADLPYTGSRQDLVYKYLGLDPNTIERQRRAVLAALREETS